ncbi:MAG: helix-turn-helix transcriptional regulator [Prosthecobacter sp.]|jgi:transcriptional regulator with XRE-family HTH domain|uniref:helix-turn-helix domain-containing protein n=1 Tax=Prosthecobacter sp. TaxID=1965333 RepID=UPI0019F91BAF|nr:helix-turn-helix transcriptional regulator [Prosthecobacter sp.]MBE2287483.1 helix-turn-helix transcriptional regulator [Prosthecobacter sp.]
MSQATDLKRLAVLISKKRNGRPLREVAAEIGGVSAPTLSRIENGNVPDLETFMKLCRWLNVSPEDFQTDHAKKTSSTDITSPERICAYLRADRTLSPETAKALTTMIELAYRDINAGKFDTD